MATVLPVPRFSEGLSKRNGNYESTEKRKVLNSKNVILSFVIDLSRVGAMFSYHTLYRPGNILWMIVLLLPLKLFFHIHVTI